MEFKGYLETYHMLSGHQCENLTIIQGLNDGTCSFDGLQDLPLSFWEIEILYWRMIIWQQRKNSPTTLLKQKCMAKRKR
jgi:hypothetical protein